MVASCEGDQMITRHRYSNSCTSVDTPRAEVIVQNCDSGNAFKQKADTEKNKDLPASFIHGIYPELHDHCGSKNVIMTYGR
jgi:hypothetical protein